MGRRLQAGGDLSLRARLVLGAVAVIGVSLVVSGVLAGVLVRRLENEQSLQQLDRAAANARRLARLGTLETLGADPGGNRVLRVGTDGQVIFDSEGTATAVVLHLGAPHLVGAALVRDGTVTIAGEEFEAAAVAYAADQLLLVARPAGSLSADTASALVPRLLIAGLIALGVAVLLAAALARTIAVPLQELAGAAEDVAAGNYARRVSPRGPAEVGIVAEAFNRMAEAVERSRTLQRDFLANVSHELKTPLTSLIGFSQALVDGSARGREEQRRAARILHEESQRLLRLSQELLDLARMESGQQPVRAEPTDLEALLRQQVDIVQPRAAERRLAIAFTAAPGLPPALADAERVQQVAENLLDNAVKYAPEGTDIRVRLEPTSTGVEAAVWNATGPQPPDVARMFERFYRAQPARAAAGGAGLGLAISRELARAMRGELSAELTGGGVVLRLRLPSAATMPQQARS